MQCLVKLSLCAASPSHILALRRNGRLVTIVQFVFAFGRAPMPPSYLLYIHSQFISDAFFYAPSLDRRTINRYQRVAVNELGSFLFTVDVLKCWCVENVWRL